MGKITPQKKVILFLRCRFYSNSLEKIRLLRFFPEYYVEDGLSDCFKRTAVDVVEIVLGGVPSGRE